ncbi:MAG: hypothetical protein J2P17_23015 [Mycobacterium sp.]|nr:hypothetical protein [Mycobacterium sp.]
MFSAQAGHNITGYNQTSRYSVAASSSADALVIGDAPAGAGTVGFTATTDAVVDWGGVAVPIL